MAIKDDIQVLMAIQEQFFKNIGTYIQGLETPEILPLKNSANNITELRKPTDEDVEIKFTPSTKDYSFRVDVWRSEEKQGFIVIAKRDLGEGITETIHNTKGNI